MRPPLDRLSHRRPPGPRRANSACDPVAACAHSFVEPRAPSCAPPGPSLPRTQSRHYRAGPRTGVPQFHPPELRNAGTSPPSTCRSRTGSQANAGMKGPARDRRIRSARCGFAEQGTTRDTSGERPLPLGETGEYNQREGRQSGAGGGGLPDVPGHQANATAGEGAKPTRSSPRRTIRCTTRSRR